jgi:hypothetical protein
MQLAAAIVFAAPAQEGGAAGGRAAVAQRPVGAEIVVAQAIETFCRIGC